MLGSFRGSGILCLQVLLRIYRSLIEPYISFGLAAWGQAAASHLNKIFLLQKRALRLMYFSDSRTHAIPLFVSSGILPLNMLYFKHTATLMHDILTIVLLPKSLNSWADLGGGGGGGEGAAPPPFFP